MPFMRDPGDRLPVSMQQVLSLIGMRDPRAAIPGPPLTTIGPRAVPLSNADDYLRRVLGAIFTDLKGAMKKPIGEAAERTPQVLDMIDSAARGSPSAQEVLDVTRSVDNPSLYADLLDRDRADDMVTWLSHLFHRR